MKNTKNEEYEESLMLDVIETLLIKEPLWQGTASALKRDLKASGISNLKMARLFYNLNNGGKVLTALSRKTQRVVKTTRNGGSHYRIFRAHYI